MRKFILTAGVIMLLSGGVYALTDGLGGYVYWNKYNPGNSASWTDVELWRCTLDTDWTSLGTENFDNVDIDCRGYASFNRGFYHNCEVLDPREDGGDGNLLVVSIKDHIPYDTTSYDQAWDIMKVNPAGGQTMITTGKHMHTGSGSWETAHLGVAMRAPENWVGTSNGLSIMTVDGIWGQEFTALYDTNGNGVIDNDASEGKEFSNVSGEWRDVEIADDGVIYWSDDDLAAANKGGIYRTWLDSSGVSTTQVYYTPGPTRLCALDTDGAGIAVGPVASNPIVYYGGQDNVETSPGTYETQAAIFALVDLNDDNDADDAGEEFKIWRDNDFSIGVQDDTYGVEDIEYWENANGDAFLLFTSYNGVLAVLELADNGVAAVDGAIIASGLNIGGYQQGFEIDMNPGAAPPIPEPGTMLLIGTGLIGILGYVRRRRMK